MVWAGISTGQFLFVSSLLIGWHTRGDWSLQLVPLRVLTKGLGTRDLSYEQFTRSVLRNTSQGVKLAPATRFESKGGQFTRWDYSPRVYRPYRNNNMIF